MFPAQGIWHKHFFRHLSEVSNSFRQTHTWLALTGPPNLATPPARTSPAIIPNLFLVMYTRANNRQPTCHFCHAVQISVRTNYPFSLNVQTLPPSDSQHSDCPTIGQSTFRLSHCQMVNIWIVPLSDGQHLDCPTVRQSTFGCMSHCRTTLDEPSGIIHHRCLVLWVPSSLCTERGKEKKQFI